MADEGLGMRDWGLRNVVAWKTQIADCRFAEGNRRFLSLQSPIGNRQSLPEGHPFFSVILAIVLLTSSHVSIAFSIRSYISRHRITISASTSPANSLEIAA